MSRNEWARGTLRLPSVAFAPLRQALQVATHQQMEKEFEFSQQFWRDLKRKEKDDLDAYRSAVSDWHSTHREEMPFDVSPRWGWTKPRRFLRSDWDWPNNRTLRFVVPDLTITFDREKRTVTYDVPGGNHAREWADNSYLGQAWNRAIQDVRWTHGTGGVILGNDEYHEDSGRDYEGGGGSYVVEAFGYIGVKESPFNVAPFLNGKGERVEVEIKTTRNGLTGKVIPYRGRPLRRVW